MHWFTIHCFGGFEHVGAKPWVHLFAGQATEVEKRLCGGEFTLVPIGKAAFVYLGPLYFDQIDSIAGSLFMAGVLLTGCLMLWLWVRFIPAKASWVAAAIAWLAVVALFLTRRT
jgi:hypothetical protein